MAKTTMGMMRAVMVVSALLVAAASVQAVGSQSCPKPGEGHSAHWPSGPCVTFVRPDDEDSTVDVADRCVADEAGSADGVVSLVKNGGGAVASSTAAAAVAAGTGTNILDCMRETVYLKDGETLEGYIYATPAGVSYETYRVDILPEGLVTAGDVIMTVGSYRYAGAPAIARSKYNGNHDQDDGTTPDIDEDATDGETVPDDAGRTGGVVSCDSALGGTDLAVPFVVRTWTWYKPDADTAGDTHSEERVIYVVCQSDPENHPKVKVHYDIPYGGDADFDVTTAKAGTKQVFTMEKPGPLSTDERVYYVAYASALVNPSVECWPSNDHFTGGVEVDPVTGKTVIQLWPGGPGNPSWQQCTVTLNGNEDYAHTTTVDATYEIYTYDHDGNRKYADTYSGNEATSTPDADWKARLPAVFKMPVSNCKKSVRLAAGGPKEVSFRPRDLDRYAIKCGESSAYGLCAATGVHGPADASALRYLLRAMYHTQYASVCSHSNTKPGPDGMLTTRLSMESWHNVFGVKTDFAYDDAMLSHYGMLQTRYGHVLKDTYTPARSVADSDRDDGYEAEFRLNEDGHFMLVHTGGFPALSLAAQVTDIATVRIHTDTGKPAVVPLFATGGIGTYYYDGAWGTYMVMKVIMMILFVVLMAMQALQAYHSSKDSVVSSGKGSSVPLVNFNGQARGDTYA